MPLQQSNARAAIQTSSAAIRADAIRENFERTIDPPVRRSNVAPGAA
jgi:hypothetical protein